jgi:hypothetical protein
MKDKRERQLHVRVPEEVYKKLKVQCVYEDTSMQDYVAKVVADSLGKYSAEGASVKVTGPRNSRQKR